MSVSAIEQDVVFDQSGAADLAAEFRAAATELDHQAGEARVLPALAARADWRGPHAEHFDQRLRQLCSDGAEIAAAFRRAASGLDEMTDAARREQQRRERARAWQHAPRTTASARCSTTFTTSSSARTTSHPHHRPRRSPGSTSPSVPWRGTGAAERTGATIS